MIWQHTPADLVQLTVLFLIRLVPDSTGLLDGKCFSQENQKWNSNDRVSLTKISLSKTLFYVNLNHLIYHLKTLKL